MTKGALTQKDILIGVRFLTKGVYFIQINLTFYGNSYDHA